MKGFKTIVFNVIMGLLAIVGAITKEAVPSAGDVAASLDTLWMIATVIGNLWLRFVTDTKVFHKW